MIRKQDIRDRLLWVPVVLLVVMLAGDVPASAEMKAGAGLVNEAAPGQESKTGEDTGIPGKYQLYVGKYTGNFGPFRNAIFNILVQNGSLAVDIPGQMVFELNEPNEAGQWILKFTDRINISFEREGPGKVTGMIFAQKTPFPRKAEPEAIGDDIPAKYRPFLGTYSVPMQDKEITLLSRDDNLAMRDPNGKIMGLAGPDQEGKWTNLVSKNKISFDLDDKGKVTALVLHQAFRIPRGVAAAAIVEKTIEASGIEEGLKKYHELKRNPPQDCFFSERSFNNLGYQLLGIGKIAEAVEIFKLNVEAYPKSWNVYDSLGEAYMKNGDNELAIKYYRKSLELNPGNENGKKVLEKLEKGGEK